MTIYIDITQFERQRANTGIQRVVKEFLQRAMSSKAGTYKVLIYNQKSKKMQQVQNTEVKLFLKDIKNFQFKKRRTINIEEIKVVKKTIFLDIDSGWNAPYKRDKLYPILKSNGFLIFNFIYDLIPVLLPQFVQNITIKNYKSFIKTVFKYSDMVILNSNSAQNDFLNYKKSLNIKRKISTEVVGLGSNFIAIKTPVDNPMIKTVLNKKYILFVGTLEPRKNQEDVLNAFDALSKKHKDLNLVFIGMKGWRVDKLIDRINSHILKDKRVFWFNRIDDTTLFHFYQNAFLVTYLSKYEGYGLPIIESLQHNNITITSKNSSMPEVGLDFTDYIEDDNLNQLTDTIALYCDNTKLYNQKKEYIKEHFKARTWTEFCDDVFSAMEGFKKSHLKKNIKAIPFFGWLARWSYNLLRLNNLKHTVHQQQQLLKKQQQQIKELSKKLDQHIASEKIAPKSISNEKIIKQYSSFYNILFVTESIVEKTNFKILNIEHELKQKGVKNFKLHIVHTSSVNLKAYYSLADVYISLDRYEKNILFFKKVVEHDIPILTYSKEHTAMYIADEIINLQKDPYLRMKLVKEQRDIYCVPKQVEQIFLDIKSHIR